ncbi:hypothetical protein ACLOJK_022635, partial [Asimina triloba]
MEEGDTKFTKTKLEGHDKGKETHYEDFSKYQPKSPFPSALEGKPISKQKLDQNADSNNQMLEKEVTEQTKAPTEAKFVSPMEEAEEVEQELPKSCILVMASTPPSVNINEEKAPKVKLKTIHPPIRCTIEAPSSGDPSSPVGHRPTHLRRGSD